jgi:hypothetical protein
MLGNFRNKKTVIKSAVFKFKEDLKVSKSYDDMDEEGIEKAFRELLVI